MHSTSEKSRIPFILFASVRTGSTMVVDILSQHPQIAAYSELFLKNPPANGKPLWAGKNDFPLFYNSPQEKSFPYPQNIYRFLEDFYGLHTNAQAIGFKLMDHQLIQHPAVFAFAKQNKIRMIHLIRKNHLDILISEALTKAIGQMHVLQKEDKKELPAISLDTSTLLNELEQIRSDVEGARELIKRTGTPHIEIAYEEILKDKTVFKEILDFLLISPTDIMWESKLVKIQRKKRSEAIANISEVKKILSGTPFESMAEDV